MGQQGSGRVRGVGALCMRGAASQLPPTRRPAPSWPVRHLAMPHLAAPQPTLPCRPWTARRRAVSCASRARRARAPPWAPRTSCSWSARCAGALRISATLAAWALLLWRVRLAAPLANHLLPNRRRRTFLPIRAPTLLPPLQQPGPQEVRPRPRAVDHGRGDQEGAPGAAGGRGGAGQRVKGGGRCGDGFAAAQPLVERLPFASIPARSTVYCLLDPDCCCLCCLLLPVRVSHAPCQQTPAERRRRRRAGVNAWPTTLQITWSRPLVHLGDAGAALCCLPAASASGVRGWSRPAGPPTRQPTLQAKPTHQGGQEHGCRAGRRRGAPPHEPPGAGAVTL